MRLLTAFGLWIKLQVDDEHVLYADGHLVGEGGQWDEVKDYNVPMKPFVLAIFAQNTVSYFLIMHIDTSDVYDACCYVTSFPDV